MKISEEGKERKVYSNHLCIEQGASHFHFSLNPINYVDCPL